MSFIKKLGKVAGKAVTIVCPPAAKAVSATEKINFTLSKKMSKIITNIVEYY